MPARQVRPATNTVWTLGHDAAAGSRHAASDCVGQQCGRSRVAQHVGQLVVLRRRIDRHEDGAQRQGGDHSGDELDAVVEEERHPVAPLAPLAPAAPPRPPGPGGRGRRTCGARRRRPVPRRSGFAVDPSLEVVLQQHPIHRCDCSVGHPRSVGSTAASSPWAREEAQQLGLLVSDGRPTGRSRACSPPRLCA